MTISYGIEWDILWAVMEAKLVYKHIELGGFSIRLLTPCLGQKMSGIAS
jgi:hypothetical protein